MTRTRSEYRLSPVTVEPPSAERVTRRVLDNDRDELAALMLDAYRGTIDDEGEDLDDALTAVDRYLAGMEHEHSFVVTEDDRVVAMAFVTVVDGVHYVDPIVVAADRKRAGLGRDAVRMLLESLGNAGVTEVGATITDSNTASERLFLGLGFTRRGPWADRSSRSAPTAELEDSTTDRANPGPAPDRSDRPATSPTR
jgi:L-amino acid N-acyltransferase YncA